MRYRIVGKVVIVVGVVLVAGAALAQTAGPTLRSPSSSIVPVTGPSTGPDLPEAAKPGLIPASPMTGTIEEARMDEVTAATAPAPRVVRAVHKPGPKAVVKKAPVSKRAKLAAHRAKTKQVAAAKRRAPTGQMVTGKPVNAGKRQAPAKSGSPAPTVLPRV